MKLRKITIKNFRGVKELDWSLPSGDIYCLIGKGDSSKSTILEAIRYAFYPQWNLTLSDSDFYQCKVENAIAIEVTIGDLVEEFCSLTKYGHCLRGWDAVALRLTDEPDDHLERVLTVRLTVEKDLEPKWMVVCDRSPGGVSFKQADRNKVSVGLIGAYSEPHRITRLIKHIREDKRGQYFLTTHSPAVLRELTVKELHIVHNNAGVVQIISAAKEELEEHEVQGKIRSSTEAFLAKKVVVCEGATEVGFLRGFDDFQVETMKDPFSFHGVALVNAGSGSKVKGLAKAFKSLCYDVSVVADADAEHQFSAADVAELVQLGIPVHVWSDTGAATAGGLPLHLIPIYCPLTD